MEKSLIDLWANFLMNEKLEPDRIDDPYITMDLVRLCEELAKKRGPKVTPYKLRLESRALVCDTAMELGIDLPAIKNRFGRTLMARSLLDAWNLAYTKRYGSTIGTASAKEAKRRDVKTKLGKERELRELHESDLRIEFPSKGATYCNAEYGVYRYGVYPKGSVLEGQQRRTFIRSFTTLEQAKVEFPTAKEAECGYQEPDLSHLPEEE